MWLAHYPTWHNSIVLPTDGGVVEYSWGDWTSYALYLRGCCNKLAAAALPTQSALGRRAIRGVDAPDLESLRRRLRCETVTALRVARSRTRALRARLAAEFSRREDTMVYNPTVELWFVHHDNNYAVWRTCNHAVAEWLQDLDCDVSWTHSLGKFSVEAHVGK